LESFDLSRRRGRNGIIRKTSPPIYFEVARDMLFGAGVAVMNPNYDPTILYSEEIIITRPDGADLLL